MSRIGVIGGSGIYALEGVENLVWKKVSTPFGDPSDEFALGDFRGRPVAFLPRHGRGHRYSPTEVPYRANFWALKSLGCDWVIALSAVGSLQEEIRPRDFVVPDQLFDRTRSRPYSFFGEGIVAHVSFDAPYCPVLRRALLDSIREEKVPVHDGGTYLCIEGPTFSTKAESRIFRAWGCHVIGMTNLHEAKLAREAEIAFATIALVTDYDVWREGEEVSVERVIENLHANGANVKRVLGRVLPRVPRDRSSPAHGALKNSIMTDRKIWPAATIEKLGPILEGHLV